VHDVWTEEKGGRTGKLERKKKCRLDLKKQRTSGEPAGKGEGRNLSVEGRGEEVLRFKKRKGAPGVSKRGPVVSAPVGFFLQTYEGGPNVGKRRGGEKIGGSRATDDAVGKEILPPAGGGKKKGQKGGGGGPAS